MNTKKGQILVITLLVLTIVAIVTVSLVSLVNRDVQQVASTQQYEDAYNTSETQLKKVLDSYGKPNTNLQGIVDTFNSPTDLGCGAVGSTYVCTVRSKDFSTTELQTTVTVEDTNKVNDFPIYKDRTFDMNLSGFLGVIDFSWDKNAAIEFEVIYKDAGGSIQSIRDVYDAGSPRIYTSLANDDPYAAFSTIHPFKFQRVAGGVPDATNVEINIANIVNLKGASIGSVAGNSPITLKVTPRMTDRYDSILLKAAAKSGTLPNQIREFTSTSYNLVGGTSTPVANIQTKVPLAAQPDSVLDSSILTNGILKNN